MLSQNSTNHLSVIARIKSNQRLQRYILVGSFAYLVEITCLYILKKSGFSDLKSVAISFWIGLIIAFVLQKFFAFKDRRKSNRIIVSQFVTYLGLVLFNYGFTLIAVRLLSPHLSVFIVRTLAIGLITLWNYSFYKFLFSQARFK